MNLFREICTVLDAASVEYTTEKVCGYDVLLVGRKTAAIIPVSITAPDPETSLRDADRLKAAVTEIVRLKGLYPLTIAEDRWRRQNEMMRARLLAHARIFTQIYARNCEVRKIDRQTAAEFLDKNHSYGDAKCRYRYGLYLKRHTGHNAEAFLNRTKILKSKAEELTGMAEGVDTSGHPDTGIAPGTLVAVATFSNARKWIKGDKTIRSYEWTRYASLSGVRLSGGMGKLLKAFIEEVRPDDIMTYADLEWSEGKVYEALGFALEGHKEPVNFYIDASWRRFSRLAQATSPTAPLQPSTITATSIPTTVTETSQPPTITDTSLQTAITDTSLQTAITATSLQTAITATSLRAKRGNLYFRNMGSNKYRLKLTDYQ